MLIHLVLHSEAYAHAKKRGKQHEDGQLKRTGVQDAGLDMRKGQHHCAATIDHALHPHLFDLGCIQGGQIKHGRRPPDTGNASKDTRERADADFSLRAVVGVDRRAPTDELQRGEKDNRHADDQKER